MQHATNELHRAPTTDYRLYRWVSEGWEAIVADIHRARHSIVIEQYIIEEGPFVRRLFGALCERARVGVDVRVLCDSFGSVNLAMSDIPRKLRDAGGQVRFYTPSWLRRDHRKVVVVDEECAFVGGLCFADWMEDWRDDTLRLTGTLVPKVKLEFDEAWAHAAGRTRRVSPVVAHTDSEDEYLLNKLKPPLRRQLYRRLLTAVRESRRSVRITTPYLSPSPRVLFAIARAARRGVRVELLLSRRSDNRLADWSSKLTGAFLSRRGVRVYEFGPAVLHAKSVVIDGRWTMVGSLNMDLLSLRLNLENGVGATHPDLVRAVEDHFRADLACSMARGGSSRRSGRGRS